jgi:hypothetical protein
MAYELKVTLTDIDPPVWRRLQLSGDLSLNQLHHALQIAMGWTDSHLHQFLIDDERYALPSPEDGADRPRDECKTRLRDVVALGSSFTYEYDFGDGWDHLIEVEHVDDAEPEAPALCTDGARACPPEDSGGPWAYAELLEIVADPRHEEYKERRDWLPEDFDAEAFDAAIVNHRLGRDGPKLKPKKK